MKKIILSIIIILFPIISCTSNQRKIVLYSPHTETLLESVADRFEQETGIKVEFLNMGTDTVVERIKSERNKPLADIIYGGSASYYADLKKEGLLVQATPSWAEYLDPSFIDPENYWFGVMQTPAILYYNTNNIKESPVTWIDLTNTQFKNKLIWLGAGGTVSTFIAVMGINNSKNGGDAKEWFTRLDENITEYHQNTTISYQAMNSPAGGISMFVLPYIADGIYNYNYPWAIVSTKDGVINIIDSVGIIANSPNTEDAKIFLEWVGSPENQKILAKDFNRMPTHSQAIVNSPQWMKDFNIPSMTVDWAQVSEQMPEWIRIYQSIRTK
ncbi:MAG: extracellular solute-binding protein [Brevinema sp.]